MWSPSPPPHPSSCPERNDVASCHQRSVVSCPHLGAITMGEGGRRWREEGGREGGGEGKGGELDGERGVKREGVRVEGMVDYAGIHDAL